MPPKSSLAALLGELNTAAPADFDPEAGYDLSEAHQRAASDADSADDDDDDDDDDQQLDHNPRAHYVDVAESKLRKKSALSEHEALLQPKYQGVKATRKQLYDQDDDNDDNEDESEAEEEEEPEEESESGSQRDEDPDEEEEEEEKEDGMEVDSEEAGDDGSDDDDDDDDQQDGAQASEDPDDISNLIRASSSSSSSKPKKSLRFQEEQPSSSTKRRGPSAASASASSSSDSEAEGQEGDNTVAAQLKQSQKLAKQLKARRVEDAEKGRHVRRQIKLWERSLEARIKAQSALRHLNQLPDPSLFAQQLEASMSASTLGGSLSELLKLSDRLFELRTLVCKLNNEASGAGVAKTEQMDPASRKRKRAFEAPAEGDAEEAVRARISALGGDDGEDVLSASISDLVALEEAMDGGRRATLEKWSRKVLMAATSKSSNAFALKAVNQSPVAQIDSALSGDGFERLLERTRVPRSTDGGESKIGAVLDSTSGPAAATTTRELDEEVFDDTDFYSYLLRELIERRSHSAHANSTAALSQELYSTHANAKGGKRGKVDTKASKGRRLRYDVNEKIVAFMPPIPTRVKWSEEQMERLFAQLAQKAGVDPVNVGEHGEDGEKEADGAEEGKVDLKGLRVFG
ncbi:rRNA-processing protein bfr2 [Thecaphora frezii]